jgi:catechol 2,3-dioxygenase-like lactoylglutathione lyase family enzyme
MKASLTAELRSGGNMFSHVTVGCTDLERSAAFDNPILAPIGVVRRPVTPDGGPPAACWIVPDQPLPRFYIYIPFDGKVASAGNGSMLAFAAPSPAAVDTAHKAGLASGGTDEGAPGPRDRYGAGYYAAYFRDPDGNKVQVAYRGDICAPGRVWE